MNAEEELSRARALSDRELLTVLSGLIRVNRKQVAEVIAHLGEVEERRLHLAGGCASMFAYCVSRLGMSEDEAYRRIEVARLARCFPLLLERLATGHLSLSVAVLLKPHLAHTRHIELIDAVSGKTVQQAREVLASWFPKPDVLPGIRKLPTRRPSTESGATGSSFGSARTLLPACNPSSDVDAVDLGEPPATSTSPARQAAHHAESDPPRPGKTMACGPAIPAAPSPPPTPRWAAPPRSIEPLSAGRYKVQLTADAELKRKLELARDLSRHAIPNGDLATILERALDLLIEKTLKRRFGVRRSRADTASTIPLDAPVDTQAHGAPASPHCRPSTLPPPTTSHRPVTQPSEPVLEDPCAPSADSQATAAARQPLAAPSPFRASRPHIPNATRRAVFNRDGARCAWRGPNGERCDSRAWLEHDHIVPRGLGGTDDPSNFRFFCRPHNRLAAERAYGQDTIARAIANRRLRRQPNRHHQT